MINFEEDDLKLPWIYRAQVLDNNDPAKTGRIKLNVFTIFDGVDKNDLPWAVPAMPLFTGSGPGYGHFAVPEIGSHVWCFFDAGDFNQPIYFAEAADGARGIPPEALTNYPNRRVVKTKSGIVIYVDDSSKEVRVIHPSGFYVVIDNEKLEVNGVVRTNTKFNVNGIDGVSGTFVSKDDKVVTVVGGIITSIL